MSPAIKFWFEFSDNSRFWSAAAAELTAGSCGNEKESIWMRKATGNRIRDLFAFKSKSFRREMSSGSFSSFSHLEGVHRRGKQSMNNPIPRRLLAICRNVYVDNEAIIAIYRFLCRSWKGFSGSRAEIDENIHKMFQFIFCRNCDCDCCVYLFTFYAIYRTQSRIRHGRRPGTLPARNALTFMTKRKLSNLLRFFPGRQGTVVCAIDSQLGNQTRVQPGLKVSLMID